MKRYGYSFFEESYRISYISVDVDLTTDVVLQYDTQKGETFCINLVLPLQ